MARLVILILLSSFVAWSGADAGRDRQPVVDQGRLEAFGAAGSFGGGPLTPGQTFPPGERAVALLQRSSRCVEFFVATSGLPEGAHSVWWVVFNEPTACLRGAGDCAPFDFGVPATRPSLVWATGAFVGADGEATVSDRLCVGDDLGFPAGRSPEQHILGDGLDDARHAEIHVVFRYHGARDPDPMTAYHQTHSFSESCERDANAHPDGSCFDPQAAFFAGSAAP